MKFSFTENENEVYFVLTPETTEEMAELARFALNAKSEKPTVYLSLSGNKPYLDIFMRKIKRHLQRNSIEPGLIKPKS